MILTQLESLDLPLPNGRQIKRRVVTAKTALVRFVKIETKKTRRALLIMTRRQYYPQTAAVDLKLAISRNEDIVLGIIISVLVLGFGVAAMALQLLILCLKVAYVFSAATGVSMDLLILIMGGVLLTFCGWLAALIQNMLLLAVMDGATGKKQRSLRSTMRRGLAQASRVTSAWVWLSAAIGAPLVVLFALFYGYIRLSSPAGITVILDIAVVAAVSAAWLLFVLMRYSLVPQVALYEPNLGVKAMFARSHKLLSRGSRLFLLSAYITLGGFILLVVELANLNQGAARAAGNVVIFSGVFMSILVFNCLMAMLYRKRRLARKY